MTWTLYNKFNTSDSYMKYCRDFNSSINYLAELGESNYTHNNIEVKLEFISDALNIMTLKIIAKINPKDYNSLQLYELILSTNDGIISHITSNCGNYNNLKSEFEKIFKEYDIKIEPTKCLLLNSRMIDKTSIYRFVLNNILANSRCCKSVESEYIQSLQYESINALIIYFDLYSYNLYESIADSESRFYRMKFEFNSNNILFTIVSESSQGDTSGSILSDFVRDVEEYIGVKNEVRES